MSNTVGRAAAGGKGKGKGHWVTVSYPNGGYHHIFVPGSNGDGVKVAVGKHRPKDKAARAAKTGETVHEGQTKGKKDSVAARRRQYSEGEEKRVAKMTGGTHRTGNEESDVDIPKANGGLHKIEVKSKHFGAKAELSVHPAALARKAQDQADNPKNTWHTVLLDTRHKSEGGAHKENYSGHEIYYRRGAGAYTVGSMHKVKDAAELNHLIAAPDHKLPPAARGSLPKGEELAALKAKAATDREYNNQRSRDRKARLKAEGKSAY